MCLLSQTVQSASRKYVVTSWSYSSSCVRLCTSCWYISFLKVFFFFLISQKSFENWLWCPLNCCKWTELTGILLGCCSRISLTSSTRCSVGQKNRLGLMEMYKAGQVLIKHKWGQRRSRYKLANRGGLLFYYSTLKNTRMHWWVNETAFM